MTGSLYFGGAPLLAALLWLASSVSGPAVAEPAVLTADQIMQHVIQRAESRYLLSNRTCSKYLYTKHTVTEELNPSGRLKDRRERLYVKSTLSPASPISSSCKSTGRPLHPLS